MRLAGTSFKVATLLFTIAGILVLSLAAPRTTGAQQTATVTVQRVVDGDTIEISPAINGKEDVRLIGVDTPETVDPGEPVQPFGPQASRFTKKQLEGKQVTLEFGEERADQFDRLLAYVRLDGSLFNETLLRQGYAQLYTVSPNDKYEARFRRAQQQARSAERGLWGLPAGKLCQLADRDNGIGGGCENTRPPSQPTTDRAPATQQDRRGRSESPSRDLMRSGGRLPDTGGPALPSLDRPVLVTEP